MSVGKNISHDSAISHVTGQSQFIDDRPVLANEIFVGFVGAPVACGLLDKVDAVKAMEVDGVLDVLTSEDFHHNCWGTIVEEQPLLVDRKIGYFGEPVCLIVAETEAALAKAKKRIRLKVTEGKPILSIDEAIEKKSYLYRPTPFIKGNAKKYLKNSEHRLKGRFQCGGQEHFYLESQATIAYPGEEGAMELHSSSQHPSETQRLVAEALGLPFHKVVCIVKRMGGGFGGKESQAAPFAAYAALAAQKFNRPARMVISKDEDMAVTGKRHPFQIDYEVGFDIKGKIQSLVSHLYADAGAYTDLTPSILDRAMFHMDGCYHLPHAEIHGYACLTNRASNTAYRGFGGPQGAMAMESLMEDIARHLKLDPILIREANLYRGDKETTPYGQKVENNVLPEIFSQMKKDGQYLNRRKEIEKFNRENKGKVKGLALTGVKFGIAFTARFLNQGNALVNLHLDGTVQVSTGATEMGQGVNTKISQVISEELGIAVNRIKVMNTSTEKNHNTSPTAASSGADINGAAAQKAAKRIRSRLARVMTAMEKGIHGDDEIELDYRQSTDTFIFANEMIYNTESGVILPLVEVIQTAYLHRISLGEYAFYKTEGLGFNKETNCGKAFSYFTNGAAVSEVTIDTYTGELKVDRVDILMDLGRSLNPGIDQGQVAGAFIQGMGWVTAEKLYYRDNGELVSHGPTTYKIPSIQDTPRTFNISLLESDNSGGSIYKSKAVGEPPFLLSASVWAAVKDAIHSHRGDASKLSSPATHEEILLCLEGMK